MLTDLLAATRRGASVPTDLSAEIGESGKSCFGAKPGKPTRGGVVIAREANESRVQSGDSIFRPGRSS